MRKTFTRAMAIVLLLLCFTVPALAAKAAPIKLPAARTIYANQVLDLGALLKLAQPGEARWASGNLQVATVDEQTGLVTPQNPGKAVITATANGKTARCTVTIKPVKVKSIALSQSSATLYLGETLALSVVRLLPSDATNPNYVWSSANKRIATVDANGVVTPARTGAVKIYATALDGSGVKAACTIKVARPYRRALLIGRSTKGPGMEALPSIKPELNALSRSLAANRIEGYPIGSKTLLNKTKAQVRAAIRQIAAAAAERDVTYLYFSGHGARSGGEFYIVPCTGGDISSAELKSWLDEVPGKVVLIVNTCYSGTIIAGKSASARAAEPDFGQSFVKSFLAGGAQGKYAAITGDKYLVLCSSGRLEESYTLVDPNSLKYLDLFGTPFAEGIGKSLAADLNGDRSITHAELYAWLKHTVNALIHELNRIDPSDPLPPQTVTAYPAPGSDFVLFAGA